MTDQHPYPSPSDDDLFPDPDAPSMEEILRVVETMHYREIDHHGGPAAEAVHALRAEITPLLSALALALHDRRPLAEHDQWTIPLGFSCGFEGELVVRVKNLGPDHRV